VVYKKGCENRGVDAHCCALSFPKPKWLDQMATSYEHDDYARDVIAKITLDSLSVPHFS
jgi:hypothetical protein